MKTYAEPVVALRKWYCGGFDDLVLRSTHRPTEWTPNEPLAARCEMPPPQLVNVQIESSPSGYFYPYGSRVRLILELDVSGASWEKLAEGIVFELDRVGGTTRWTNSELTLNPPHEEHSCGIYAMSGWRNSALSRTEVLGIVELYGKVIPAEHGWRAQYAKISAIVGTRPDQRDRDAEVASRYGVPLLTEIPELTNSKQFKPKEEQ